MSKEKIKNSSTVETASKITNKTGFGAYVLTLTMTLSLMASFFMPIIASAEENERSIPRDVNPMPLRIETKSEIMELRDDRMEARKEIKAEARDDRKEIRIEVKASGQIGASTTRAALQENRQMMLKALRENASTTREEIKAKREELKVKLEARREEIKNEIKKRLDDNAKNRIEKRIENVYGSFSNRIERLVNADAALTAKVNASQSEGVYLETTISLLTTAQGLLSKAKLDVEATKGIVIDELTTETSKEQIRLIIKTANESIVAAAKAYKDAVQNYRAVLQAHSTTSVEVQ